MTSVKTRRQIQKPIRKKKGDTQIKEIRFNRGWKTNILDKATERDFWAFSGNSSFCNHFSECVHVGTASKHRRTRGGEGDEEEGRPRLQRTFHCNETVHSVGKLLQQHKAVYWSLCFCSRVTLNLCVKEPRRTSCSLPALCLFYCSLNVFISSCLLRRIFIEKAFGLNVILSVCSINRCIWCCFTPPNIKC